MLLGMPFFAATNPKINWTAGTFHGKVTACTTNSYKWSYNRDRSVYRPFMLNPQDISLRMLWDEPVRAKWTIKSTELAINTHKKEIIEAFRRDPTNEYRYCKYKKLVPGTLDDFKGLSKPPKEPEDNWQDFIPKEYHQYAKVFSSHCYAPQAYLSVSCFCFQSAYYMCTTGPLTATTGHLLDLAAISMISSYSLNTSFLLYLPILDPFLTSMQPPSLGVTSNDSCMRESILYYSD